jgi:hypothetical protein
MQITFKYFSMFFTIQCSYISERFTDCVIFPPGTPEGQNNLHAVGPFTYITVIKIYLNSMHTL